MPATDGSLIFNTKIDTSGMEKDAKGVSSKVVDLRNKVSSTAAAVKNLRDELEKTGDTKVKTKVTEKVESDIEKTDAKLVELRKKAIGMYDFKVSELRSTGITSGVEEAAERALEADDEYKKLISTIEKTSDALVRYENELTKANDSAPLTKDTAEYKKKEQRLSELTGQLEVYKAKLSEAEQEEQQTAAQTGNVSRKTNNYRQYIKQTVTALRMFVTGLGKAYNALKKTFSNTIGRAIKSISSKFSSANSSLNILSSTLTRIKSLIRSVLLYKITSNWYDTIKDGLGEISKISPKVNKNLSDLKTSFTYLKNSLSALAAPLLNVITPALVNFMDVISNLTEKLTKLTAILSGQSTYTKAVKVQEDYAASLDDTTDSVKNNTKAVKENQKNLAKFDELNVMSDDSSDDDSTSSQSAQPMFENVTAQVDGIEKTLLDALKRQDWNAVGTLIGDKVNSALNRFDWTKIKRTARKWAVNIADLFNGFLKETDWNKVGETAAEGVNTAISFMLGFSYTFDWKLFGQSLRTSLVSFFNNLNKDDMIDAFDSVVNGLITAGIELVGDPDEWEQWGTELENSIMKALKGVKWEDVKTLFGNLLKGIFNFSDGFFGSLFSDLGNALDGKDFNAFGKQLAENINNIDWEKTVGKDSTIGKMLQVISKAVIAGLDFVIGFLENPGTADSLSEGVSTLLENVDWANILIKALTALFDAVAWITDTATQLIDDFATGLCDGFDATESNPELMAAVKKLGKSICNALISILESGINVTFSTVPKLIIGLVKLIATGFAGVAHAIYEKVVGADFADDWYNKFMNGLNNNDVLTSSNAPRITLPRLATGTVVPANYGEFLAVLGDNKREPEVVSPVSSMKQAFLEALAEVGYNGGSDRPIYCTVVLEDGTALFRSVAEEDDRYFKSHGNSRFDRRQST